MTEPDWNPNSGGLAFLGHYRKCKREGLKKGGAQAKEPEHDTSPSTQTKGRPFEVFRKDLPGL